MYVIYFSIKEKFEFLAGVIYKYIIVIDTGR
jgi:hypothetical protein